MADARQREHPAPTRSCSSRGAGAGRFVPEDYDRKLVTELWMYPDGSRILELSTRCKPGEAFDVDAKARAYLSVKA
jgi:hypothetical protein